MAAVAHWCYVEARWSREAIREKSPDSLFCAGQEFAEVVYGHAAPNTPHPV